MSTQPLLNPLTYNCIREKLINLDVKLELKIRFI